MTAPELSFTLALHRLLATDPARGFAWSPYSVASALGVVAAGARGRTRDELAEVVGDLDALAAGLSAGAALKDDAVTIGVANTLWADLTLPVAPEYLAAVKSWPGGTARGADFRGDAEGVRQEINADVSRSTRDLIKDLLPAGLLDRETRAVIVNALYLRASWTKPFEKGQTRPQPFRTPGGEVSVPTMRTTRSLPYAARSGWTLVSVPAGGGVLADVLLPDGDLAPLDAATLTDLLAAATPREVALELPRVTVRGQASLAEPLAGLGIQRLFGDQADLTGVTGGKEGLKVDAALHKAVLTLDEAGLEGAAATALMMTRLAAITAPPRPVAVRVDRPFLLQIRHRPTNALYFLAQVTDPR
ncbi:MAG TPA: serpin family protein [Mycobacteriales bacterium]|nr:serpin family protein [Mycobacteriales bacterium]